jgi:hypothetical protein
MENSKSTTESAEHVKVARPTTKPTDRTKKVENSYTFWKETDEKKL